ncbi:riboflavin synthase alpha chain [Natronoarchaeum philippinense]|uniref:Riboflavin synthase alpha chain n=1 Tax=Natronoarchaeum philippinense TaxID=558529 RepID=A0A285NX43_NATPI|nr:riboflavin synthase [Natronoarchaeum philippinense]SNZ12456.1 riboflavin synthase alpha chain [Natronoarchaeum philippinense]
MYAGLVSGTGRIEASTADGEGHRLRIDTNGLVDPELGDSVSVSGVCLTADRAGDGWFEAFLSTETVERTYLAELPIGAQVNLESPLALGESIDGHLVGGTVTATSEVAATEDIGTGWRYEFSIPDGFAPYLAEKGAVAVDGASLTVSELAGDRFAVAVIPETRELTTLSEKSRGDPVHLEPDPVATYVDRQMMLGRA